MFNVLFLWGQAVEKKEITEECEIEEEMTETQKLMKQVKDSGVAGFVSYAPWEWAF
jgi:hypothetical protein